MPPKRSAKTENREPHFADGDDEISRPLAKRQRISATKKSSSNVLVSCENTLQVDSTSATNVLSNAVKPMATVVPKTFNLRSRIAKVEYKDDTNSDVEQCWSDLCSKVAYNKKINKIAYSKKTKLVKPENEKSGLATATTTTISETTAAEAVAVVKEKTERDLEDDLEKDSSDETDIDEDPTSKDNEDDDKDHLHLSESDSESDSESSVIIILSY
jgi:hypothetical protein